MGKNVAQIVTERILNRMAEAEKNAEVFRWVKPFAIGAPDKAYSYETLTAYSGINRLLLDKTEYLSLRVLKCINNQKGSNHYKIRKGAKSDIVCFYSEKTITDKDTGQPIVDEETGEEITKKIIRYTPVFSREDIIRTDNGEALPSKFNIKHFNHKESIELMGDSLDRFNRLFNYYCEKYDVNIEVVKDGTQAYFSQSSNGLTIRVPEMTNFKSIYDFVTCIAHEMGHSTGVILGRFEEKNKTIDSQLEYAREELIAEITAEIIASELQILDDSDTHDNSVAYIHSWSSFLKDRPTEILRASAAAEKASQIILETLKEMEHNENQINNNISERGELEQ